MIDHFLKGGVCLRDSSNYIRCLYLIVGVFITDAEESRICKMSLGGGTILDLGIYCINLITWSFGDEKPESVTSYGSLYESEGTDESVTSIMKFGKNRLASFSTHASCQWPNRG